ncbi:MAG: tetratricopeptide repeat protein, partial [Woeseiaceae bacterium]|nr:tetratricopeptide repeat protein [Woeseiaceae bacterium]
MSFITELKRRNVVRMALLYAVASWVILQIADVLFEQLGVPPWAFRLVFGLLVLGFPIALIFSWIFELTPEGVKRTGDVVPGESVVAQTGQRMNLLIVVLLVIAIGLLAADRFSPSGDRTSADSKNSAELPVSTQQPGAAVTPDASIAVLPFVNMSGDPENDYFSDGLSEELLNTLVKLGGLKVTGRTSSFAFKDQNVDLREIGETLNVASVLEGSVRKAGNRVRITAQLIETRNGYHLWSETFDRELDDIFVIQEEIAAQVAGALHVTLLGVSAAVEGSDPEAYEEYLRGVYVLQRNPDELEPLDRAQAHFEKALGIDPEYVDALAGMFKVWDFKNRNGWGEFLETLGRMKQIAGELERLAPENPQTLSAIGRIAIVNFDYARSEKYLGRAATRYPASVPVLGEYATALSLLGRYPEAIAVVDRASSLDPLSLDVMRWKSFFNFKAGNCGAAEEVRNRALEIEPDAGRYHYYSAMCIFETSGEVSAAIALAEKEPLGWARNTALAILYDAAGDASKAQTYFDAMVAEYGDSASYQYGQINAQWG